jgi:hypothetical protein
MAAPNAPEEPVLVAGLSLEQVAGIQVALAEPLPLADILAQEKVEEAAFRTAEAAFRARIGVDRAALAAYGELLAIAEDSLARKTPPLDSDPRAWGAFVGHLAQSKDEASTLRTVGLAPNDLARLRRLWHKKALTEEPVRLAIREGRERPRPIDVRPEPQRLKPFPWSPGASGALPKLEPWEAMTHAVGSQLPIERDVDLYAALTVALEGMPEERALALDLACVSERDLPALQDAWRERLRVDAAQRAEFSVRVTDHRAALSRHLSD